MIQKRFAKRVIIIPGAICAVIILFLLLQYENGPKPFQRYVSTAFDLTQGIKRSYRCPLCGTKKRIATLPASTASFIEEYVFKTDKRIPTLTNYCLNCSFYFSDIRYTGSQLERLYSSYREGDYVKIREKHEPGYTALNQKLTDDNLSPPLRRKYVEKFLDDNGVNTKSIRTVVDYGGDRGQFIPDSLMSAERYVYEISRASTIPGVKRLNRKDLRGRSFDMVLCMHVFEHVPDPKEILTDIHGLLQKQGLLYIELPAELEPDVSLSRASTIVMHEHINIFTPRSLEKWLPANGFTIIKNWSGVLDLGYASVPIIQCLARKN